MARNFSNTAVQTTLAAGITAAATTITVSAVTGFPAADFVLALDADAASQELVLVTAIAGTTLTVTRGYDNTTAVAHDAGAVVRHSHAAIDFREAQAHADATAAHGATGAVVGTTNVQTLTNKTLTTPTVASFANAAHNHTNAAGGGQLTDAALSAAVTVPKGGTGATTLASGNFLQGNGTAAVTATKAVPTGVVVGTTDVQTLTNKTLASPVVTGVGKRMFVNKAVTESVTSSTTLQDDDELTVPLEANSIYRGTIGLDVGGAGGGVKMTVSITATGSVIQSLVVVGASTQYFTGGAAPSTLVASASAEDIFVDIYVKTSGTAGNLTVQWAQQVSSATATTVKVNSFIDLTRVA